MHLHATACTHTTCNHMRPHALTLHHMRPHATAFHPQGNPDSGVTDGMGEYKLPPGMKIPNFGSLADTNSTIKVPKGTKKRAVNATLPEFGTEAVSPFVSIQGSQFDKDCRPFYPTGFNGFELFILAAREWRADAPFRCLVGQQQVLATVCGGQAVARSGWQCIHDMRGEVLRSGSNGSGRSMLRQPAASTCSPTFQSKRSL